MKSIRRPVKHAEVTYSKSSRSESFGNALTELEGFGRGAQPDEPLCVQARRLQNHVRDTDHRGIM